MCLFVADTVECGKIIFYVNILILSAYLFLLEKILYFSSEIFACFNFLPLLCIRFRHATKCSRQVLFNFLATCFSVFFELKFFSKKKI